MRVTEELILSGKMLPAYKLHEMGIVDVLAPNGHGESAVLEWIASNAKRRNGMQAMLRARQFVRPVTRAELDSVVELWVDAAMRLGERELKMMSRLARAQTRRMEHALSEDVDQIMVPVTEEPLAVAV
jgi:DSF synthase